jgi:hypothetical protein
MTTQNERPFQFSLRALLVFSVAFALLMKYWRPLFELAWDHEGWATVCLVPLLGWLGLIAGRLLSCLIVREPVRNISIGVSWILLFLASASICYLVWSRHRWIGHLIIGSSTAQSWPFPDSLLISLHGWLDARNLPSTGGFKIDGEFYTVWLVLDLALLVFVVLIGAILAIVAPGLPRWARKAFGNLGV